MLVVGRLPKAVIHKNTFERQQCAPMSVINAMLPFPESGHRPDQLRVAAMLSCPERIFFQPSNTEENLRSDGFIPERTIQWPISSGDVQRLEKEAS